MQNVKNLWNNWTANAWKKLYEEIYDLWIKYEGINYNYLVTSNMNDLLIANAREIHYVEIYDWIKSEGVHYKDIVTRNMDGLHIIRKNVRSYEIIECDFEIKNFMA